MTNAIQGIHFMMPTPFTKESNINFESIDRLFKLSIENGCHGIVIMGVMGEAHRLTEDERNAVINHVSKRVDGRIPITVGVSGESIEIVSKRIKELSRKVAIARRGRNPEMLQKVQHALATYQDAIRQRRLEEWHKRFKKERGEPDLGDLINIE